MAVNDVNAAFLFNTSIGKSLLDCTNKSEKTNSDSFDRVVEYVLKEKKMSDQHLYTKFPCSIWTAGNKHQNMREETAHTHTHTYVCTPVHPPTHTHTHPQAQAFLPQQF